MKGGGDAAGLWVVVGLLGLQGVVRSSAPILEFKGEVKDSFLALTGRMSWTLPVEVGEEGICDTGVSLPSTKCSPLLFWLVAKNSSNDLKEEQKLLRIVAK